MEVEEKVAWLISKFLKAQMEHALGTARLGWGVGALVTAPVTACGSVQVPCPDEGESYSTLVCLWYHVDVGDSLNSLKSKPQLLKRKWSKDMTRKRAVCGERWLRKACERRAKARDKKNGLRLRKLRKCCSLGSLRLRK